MLGDVARYPGNTEVTSQSQTVVPVTLLICVCRVHPSSLSLHPRMQDALPAFSLAVLIIQGRDLSRDTVVHT